MSPTHLFAHPSVPFEEHASTLLHWLRAGITLDTTQRRERIDTLNSYLLFRLSPKMLSRLQSGREVYVRVFEEVERRWDRGEVAFSGDTAGEGKESRLWAVCGVPEGREAWPELWRVVVERKEMEAVYTAATSRDFNRFLLRQLSTLESGLETLAGYTTSPPGTVPGEYLEARKKTHFTIQIIYNLVHDPALVLQTHMRFVDALIRPSSRNTPQCSSLDHAPPFTYVRTLAAGWKGVYRETITTWQEGCRQWLALLYRPIECAHRFQGMGRFSMMRKVLPGCDVGVVRGGAGEAGMAPWEEVVVRAMEGGWWGYGRAEAWGAVERLRREAEMAPLESPLKKLLGEWRFEGAVHPLSLMAGLRDAAREKVECRHLRSLRKSKTSEVVPVCPYLHRSRTRTHACRNHTKKS